MGRILAIDYGKVRTGLAVTDEMQLIASGLTTVPTGDLLQFLTKYVREENVETIVVGEPKQMDNTPSESEALIQPFLEKLKEQLPGIEVYRQDERFTSKMATQSMIDIGMKKKQRRKKELLDEISATIILQAYLDRI